MLVQGMADSTTNAKGVLGDASRWPEKAVRGRWLNSQELLNRIFVREFRRHGSELTEQPHEMSDSVTPVIAWVLMRNSLGVFVSY